MKKSYWSLQVFDWCVRTNISDLEWPWAAWRPPTRVISAVYSWAYYWYQLWNLLD